MNRQVLINRDFHLPLYHTPIFSGADTLPAAREAPIFSADATQSTAFSHYTYASYTRYLLCGSHALVR